MFSLGLFQAQINEAEVVLRAVDLLDGARNSWRCPIGIASMVRGKTYRESWQLIYANQWYDFVLRDFSMLQFSRTENELRYAYYDSPLLIIPYEDFVTQELGEDVELVGEMFREEYEQAIESSPAKESVTPFRYDYDPAAYRQCVHPASHLHIGASNNIRIGTKKILRPLSFVLLVMRQCYPHEWLRLIDMADAAKWCRQVKEDLDAVPDDFFQEKDKHEQMLI
jgi:hypothetical protein